MKKTEILSPVGSSQMLEAAVRSGADAVYLGAKDFSARRNAENFDIEELKKAVEYCHIRGVRVYLTLNILVKNSELESAFLLAKDAYNSGIDGIIVQDLGLARILRKKIPSLPLHASTQMSVHSPAALPYLKEMGFCQVVAAREMSKEELKKLCEKAKELGMTVEVFVHGALCMCLSGQCLLSAFLGSRSGNRGLCAGPCRLPFKVNNGTGYDLSLKDLSLLEYLRELEEIGVGSFKIEGRMKRPEYVAAATAACRQALDNGFVEKELEETLKNVFSRSGFTDGYYTDNLGKNMFGIRTREDVVSADKEFPKLHELYRSERKSVGIRVKAEICENEPIFLTLSDSDGNCVTAFGEKPQKAQNKPLTKENAIGNLCKFGGTAYYEENVEISLENGLFVSAGELNKLRREAVCLLDEKRCKIREKNSNEEYISTFKTDNEKRLPVIICRFENKEQIPDDLSGVAAITIPLEEAPDIYVNNTTKIVDIPRGISSEEALAGRLKSFKENGFVAALCGNLATVEIAKKAGLSVLADTGLNIYNHESVETVAQMGAKGVVLSSEITLGDCGFESSIPKGITAYGNIPLMLFKNCPLKNGTTCDKCDKSGVITDRLGVEFPVRCRFGYSEMLNSVPLWLADRKEELEGLDFIVLYFTRETKERVSQVIEAYKRGYDPDVKHTRGLYWRGTI